MVFFFIKVHMEADRKATAADSNMELDPPILEKVTYRVGSKVTFQTNCLIVKGLH